MEIRTMGAMDSGPPWLCLVFRLRKPDAQSITEYPKVYIYFRNGQFMPTPSPAARLKGNSSGSDNVVSAAPRLSPQIPPPDAAKYRRIQDGGQWRNPYISVQGDGIHYLTSTAPTRWKRSVTSKELRAILTALPSSRWPYGRVVAVQDGGGPVSGIRESQKRHKAAVQKLLKELGVTIEWWPGA